MALLCAFAVPLLPLAAEPAANPTTAATRRLEDLPNLTITYYDVSGTDIRSINDSILMQQGEQLSTSSASWDMSVSLTKRQVDTQCQVASANVRFSATVKLPRLVNEEQLKPQVRAAWHSYLETLRSRQAADLWFVHDRVPQVEQAVRNSSCDGAGAAASAAIEKVKAEEAAFIQANSAAE